MYLRFFRFRRQGSMNILSLDPFLSDATWFINFDGYGVYVNYNGSSNEGFILLSYPSDMSYEQVEQIITDTYADCGKLIKRSVFLVADEDGAYYMLPSDITAKELNDINHGFWERLEALYYERNPQAQGSDNL